MARATRKNGIMDLKTSVSALRAVRGRHGHALRSARRAGAKLIRTALDIAAPMLAAEARPLPPYRLERMEGGFRHWPRDTATDSGRGVLLIDDTRYEREQCGHDESTSEDGWQVWARPDGSLVEVYREQHGDRYQAEAAWLHGPPRPIGLREVERRYTTERVVESLCSWVVRRTEAHKEATEMQRMRADRFQDVMRVLTSS